MATAVLFIGWNQPHDLSDGGKKAYGWLTTEGVSYLKGLEGKAFERMELVALTPHGGELNGCIVLFGERTKLDELRRTDAFEAFNMNMWTRFDRYGVVPGLNGEGIAAMMKRTKMT